MCVGAGGVRAQSAPTPGQRVALVTGSTSGLGRDVALRLAADGAHVILHGRNVERGEEVLREIEREGKGSARFYRADFAAFGEVRALAEAILADYDRLDVLVNNAGFGSAPDERWVTDDGVEFRFQVNYLAHYLLTDMLLPVVRSSAPARIVNVSSLAQSPIDWEDPMIEKNFSGGRAYGQSKLAQVAHTLDLHEELDGTGVIVNSLHPATYMPTGMVRRSGVEPRSTIDDGADAVMQLAVSPALAGKSGLYYNQMNEARSNVAQAYEADARARLHAIAKELTGVG
jgi:NAD(P)-dependent dehydrogenase (short-subunit alcohol dehydrogenase family)